MTCSPEILGAVNRAREQDRKRGLGGGPGARSQSSLPKLGLACSEDRRTRRKLELRGKIEPGCSVIPETPWFTPGTSYFTSTLRDSRVWGLSLNDW